MNKTSFKIIFYDEERKPMTLYAEHVYQSDILGFIEVEKLTFPELSEIIATPDDDKIRKTFRNAVKTLIPINLVVRIDEVSKETKAHVINIYDTEK